MSGEKIFQKAKVIIDRIYAEPELQGNDRKIAYEKYLKLIRKASYLGHSEAQWELGLYYDDMNCLYENNPNYNPKKCVYWFSKACDKNISDACNSLANLYEKGEGCEQSIKKSLELYKKAADLGNDLGKDNHKLLLKQIKQGKYKL
jgi:TPR repeat protein